MPDSLARQLTPSPSSSVPTQDPTTQVVLLKKSQGSVWLEMGRTSLCPTVSWLSDKYGAGQYELRLRHGNRTLCMTSATAE